MLALVFVPNLLFCDMGSMLVKGPGLENKIGLFGFCVEINHNKSKHLGQSYNLDVIQDLIQTLQTDLARSPSFSVGKLQTLKGALLGLPTRAKGGI